MLCQLLAIADFHEAGTARMLTIWQMLFGAIYVEQSIVNDQEIYI